MIDTALIQKIEILDPNLKEVMMSMLSLVKEVDEKTKIITLGTSDFNELKSIVRELAEAQKKTEIRLEELAVAQKKTESKLEQLTASQKELAEAQKKTEAKLEQLTASQKELAEAQKKTEAKLEQLAEAQKKTEIRLEELAEAQKKTEAKLEQLAEAQKKTEAKLEQLTEAQKKTEIRLEQLAEAQKKTEAKVEELTEAQKKTEAKLEQLTEAQKKTEEEIKSLTISLKEVKKQVGGLTMDVGYGIEDKIMPFIQDFAKTDYGIDISVIDRRNIFYPDGRYDEINIYAEGKKDGNPCWLIGECKAQPGKKDFDKYSNKIDRLRNLLQGDIITFMAGYQFSPDVEIYAQKKYPHIRRIKTFEFELRYQKIIQKK